MGFEVYQVDGGWRWRLVGADGIVASGQPCQTLEECLAAIHVVRGANGLTPIFNADTGLLVQEQAAVRSMLSASTIGNPSRGH
jgi:hypothetical protein